MRGEVKGFFLEIVKFLQPEYNLIIVYSPPHALPHYPRPSHRRPGTELGIHLIRCIRVPATTPAPTLFEYPEWPLSGSVADCKKSAAPAG